MRSARFMDFNERDFNEYLSDDDEEEGKNIDDVDFSADDGSGMSLGNPNRARSAIFKSFKPGINNDLRQIPNSA